MIMQSDESRVLFYCSVCRRKYEGSHPCKHQIAERAAEIRSGWSDAEMSRRAAGQKFGCGDWKSRNLAGNWNRNRSEKLHTIAFEEED